jgi:hypothetical protein
MASNIYNLWGRVSVSRFGLASGFGFKGSVWASRFGAGGKVQKTASFRKYFSTLHGLRLLHRLSPSAPRATGA